MPNLFVGHNAGDVLPAADWQTNWNLVEASFGVIGPYIQAGLVPTAGTGLAVNVSSGNALISGNVVKGTAWTITSLADNTVNHLYLLQNGTGTSNTTGTAPANSVKLGTATTAGGVVTSVDTNRSSGRQLFLPSQNLVPGGPGAGNPASIDLSLWATAAGNGVTVFGTLPSGAMGTPNFTKDDANQNSVQTALTIGHTYNAGGGAAGIGVEQDFLVESSTNGTNRIAANLQATLTDLTPSTATGKLSFGVIANNVQVIPMTVATGDVRIPQATVASSGHGLLNIGSGGFDGSGGHFAGDSPGTLLAMNAPSGYTGTYIDVQKNGARLLYLDQFGTMFRLSAPVATANDGLVSIGDSFSLFDGSSSGHFVGSANGTYLAINAAAAATARLIDIQVGGVSKFLMGVGGVLTLSNKLATQGLQVGQATKTANYTLLTTDTVIVGDTTGGSFTVTLPTASSGTGQLYVIIKKVAANTLTLQGNGAETINGANTQALTTIYSILRVVSDGTQWYSV